MKISQPHIGSALLWIIAILGVILVVAAGLIWGKTFLLTEGLDSSQVNTYTNAINKTQQVQNKVNNLNDTNSKTMDKLNQLQKQPSAY